MPLSTDELLAALLAGIERELPLAIDLRHRLHARPELAHAEHETSAAVAQALPVPSEAAVGTGLIARVGPAAAPAVAVRAELDGLPLSERTGAAFSADGDTMHACGHDVHMAALVALTRAAHAFADDLPAALVAVLQPSEEAYPSGAEQLAQGALASLEPAAIVAAHVHPELAWNTVALDPGAVNGSFDALEIVVTGEPTHGAYPHRGRDPVLALAQIVVALHAALGRRIDPLRAATLTISMLEAGEAENVIPASARGRGALRAHHDEDRKSLRTLAREVAHGVAEAHGCSASVHIEAGEPPLENDPAISSAARGLLVQAGLTPAPAWRSCGSDDLAFFSSLAPLAMAFVGLDGADGFVRRPLHHPQLLPPDSAVGAVARTLAVLYVAGARAGAS